MHIISQFIDIDRPPPHHVFFQPLHAEVPWYASHARIPKAQTSAWSRRHDRDWRT